MDSTGTYALTTKVSGKIMNPSPCSACALPANIPSAMESHSNANPNTTQSASAISASEIEPWILARKRRFTNSVPTLPPQVFVQQPAKSISPMHPCVYGKRRRLEPFLLQCLKLQHTVRSLSL